MKKPLFLISLLILCFCKSEKPDTLKLDSSPPIKVEVDSLYQTKYFSLSDSSDTYVIEVFLSDLNKGIMRYRYEGERQLSQQIKPIRNLLEHVFADSSISNEFTTLQWGSLIRSEKNDFIMAQRLAMAAAQSNKWNKSSGKPFQGHENTFVQIIANEQNIYPELTDLFNELGYKIEISGVEKVFIQTAVKLPFWENISGQVNENAKLPYDCQTWFKIVKDTQ
ncbi:MAG: hypothetical protein D8M58_06905 [Calditrichaeota bacterium]|nr:MAG: hypothetical protein DWQ03_19595 [Calditrichota bacterium]MBL1205108.1 hypothetical protein [Calditrichota bacterium]NOG44938.1 hypothetical protein [Calditrichota bacterium]